MASSGDERRMVFDIRGRRRNVVKVVYAILALLMGLSLLLLAGPGIGGIFNQASTNDAAGQLEDQAEAIELRLKKDPQNPQLLLGLTRARINAGNALAVASPETGEIAYSPEARQQLEAADEAWSKYLKETDEPNPSGAQLIAQALYALAQTARTGLETEVNMKAAAKAQRIVAEARPSLGSLSTLAIYRYFAFDYKGAAQARKEALPYANTKFERENLGNELDQTSKRAQEFQTQLASIERRAKKARERGETAPPSSFSNVNPLTGE